MVIICLMVRHTVKLLLNVLVVKHWASEGVRAVG